MCCIIFAANLFCNRGVMFVLTSLQQTCFASVLVDYALLLCRKFAAKLPHQVCHGKLISRKIKLAASVHAIWEQLHSKLVLQVGWSIMLCYFAGSSLQSCRIKFVMAR
ncbi:hypothetical protein AVEN_62916-1 [Araneus ventricosus]|uniref:Uncharacterized protein n=1 Tax=Araneus ventricosus TaxID=182803 RepID=A0A4Y2JE48_ARAVE|nr:hypothetical protein AVEN_62916-1 [Araneus ventricosus]